MDSYTRKTKDWLEQRFKSADDRGFYQSHAPIYGFSKEHIFLGLYKNNYTVLREIERLLSMYTIRNFLEVGCAEGYTAHLIEAIFGLNGKVSDISLEALKRSSEIYGLQGFVADAQHLECVKSDSFDLVLCSETLEHLPQPQNAFNELTRIAKKALIITVPAARDKQEKEGFHPTAEPNTHLQVFAREDLCQLPFFSRIRGISFKWLDKLEGLFTKDGKVISSQHSNSAVVIYRLARFLFSPLRKVYGVGLAKIFISSDYLMAKFFASGAISYMSVYQKSSAEFEKKIKHKDILDFILKQDKVKLHLLSK